MTSLELPGGRRLEATVAPGDGPVLLWHHGTPGAATPLDVVRRAAERRGLRLVTYSRAGYAGSTRHADRSVADVVPDLVPLLDHLDVGRCVTAGWSGGGPHALALAALLPERVAGVLSIAGAAPHDAEGLDFLAGMGPDNVAEFGAAAVGETTLRADLEPAALGLRDAGPDDVLASMAGLLPPVDAEALRGELGPDLAANLRAAASAGVDGWVDDDLAFVRPWGFDLADLAVPAYVWQGTADLMVPLAHGEWLAAYVPGATRHVEADEGHLSLVVHRIDAMLEELADTL